MVSLASGRMSKRARQRRRPRRPRRRHRPRRRCGCCRCVTSIDQARHHRPRQGAGRVEGVARLLRAVRPRPHRARSAGSPPSGASSGGRSPTVDLGLLVHERELEVLRSLVRAARRRRCSPATERAPHKVATWVRELADRFHGFYHDCYVMGEGVSARAHPGPAVAGRGGPHRARDRPRPARGQRARVDVSRPTVDREPSLPWRRCCPTPPRSAPTGGCRSAAADLVDAGRRVRHAAVRLRRGPPAGPLPRGGRRLRRRRRLRHQGVPLPGHGRASRTRRACTSTSPPAASCTSPWPPACPAERLVLHGNNKSDDELRRARDGGRRPHRRRQLRRARPPRARCTPPTALVPHGAAAGHARASRPTPTSTCAPARTTRSSASALATGAAAEAVDRAAASAAGRPRRPPRPHRQPGVRRRLLPPGGRGAGAVRRRARPARAVDRRRPRRGLRRGRGGADDRRSGRSVGARGVRGGRRRPPGSTAEPGRAIVAAAAVTLYTVGTVKELPGIRTYVVGRRRHERQPPAGPLRQRLRGVPAPGRRRRPAPRPSPSSASTASRATCSCATPRCPTTSPSATCWPRRSPAPTATRWASNYNKVPAPAGGVRRATASARLVVVRRETDRRPAAPRRRLTIG